jgi:allophanate hydrolase subunit 2
VQTPPGGEPIILMADAQTTGGYAVPAVVISADLGRLAQLRPGDRVRFALVSLDDALEALRARRRRLEAALAAGVRNVRVDEILTRGFAEWSEAADPGP